MNAILIKVYFDEKKNPEIIERERERELGIEFSMSPCWQDTYFKYDTWEEDIWENFPLFKCD